MFNRNRVLLAVCLSFIISVTWAADDISTPTATSNDLSEHAQADEKKIPTPLATSEVEIIIPAQAVTSEAETINPVQTVTSEAETSTPTSPVACEIQVPVLQKTRALLVEQKIELFRTTINETNQEKGMFSRLFSSSANPVDAELILEMRQFTESYAGLPLTDEVYYLLAKVHKRTKSYPAAALNLLLLKVMYPQSSFVPAANKELKELSADQLAKQAAMIAKLNRQTDLLSGDMDQRTGGFIEFLGSFREVSFAASIAAESVSFMARNQTFQNEDLIESAIAHQSMLIDNDISIYRFHKLLALYPASNLRADSLLGIASIQREKLKLYDKAAKTFWVLIEKHPDSNEAQSGYEALATMYTEDMRDYPNAIRTYDAIIAKYKKDPIVLRSLLSLEKIYEFKTGQLDKAIGTYLRLADIFEQEQDGLNALIAAENIAFNSTQDWILAMSINDRIYARAADSEFALKAVYSNANIMENKLGDKVKAKEMYEKFVKEHPDHTLTKDAQKRIDAINKKS